MKAAAPDSPALLYKKGDIVWVIYRGKTEYPAKVTAYYPKEKKVSHNWFPLSNASLKSVFKTDQGKVRPFSIDDPCPETTDQTLVYSYEQAISILKGTPEQEVINEYEQALSENPKPASAKKKSTAELLKKTTASPKTPKSAAKGKKKQQQQQYQEELPDLMFEPGEQIIVDTQIGMWPGIFKNYVEGEPEKIRYTLFPRKTSSEVLTGPKNNIIPFPIQQIEASLGEGNGSEQLMEALQDALAYVRDRIAKQNENQQSSSGNATRTPKEAKEVKNLPRKKQAVTPKENIQKAAANQESVNQQEQISAQKPTKTKATGQARLSEKRQSSQEQQKNSASASPAVKRRKLNTTGEDYETEEERQLGLFPERRSKSNNSLASASKSTNGHMEQQQLGGEEQKEAKEEVMEELQPPQSQVTEKKVIPAEKRSFFELVMSEEAHEHMCQVWSKIEKDWFKQLLNAQFFHMDFRNGGLMTFKETEKLFSQVQQWIKLSDLPTLTHLREMYYITKYVLPELCAFAISKQHGTSIDEANRLYEERLAMHKDTPEASGASPKASNSLDTLVMAANLMQNGEEDDEKQ